MNEFKTNFITETNQLLDTLERNLLDAEKNTEDYEIHNSIFRILHTIKGSAGMFEYKDVETVVHASENLFNNILSGKLILNNDIINIGFDIHEFVKKTLEEGDSSEIELLDKKREILKKINRFVETKEEKSKKELTGIKSIYLLFEPNSDFSEKGINLEDYLRRFENLGEHIKFEKASNISDIMEKNKFYMFWEYFIVTEFEIDELKNLFFNIEDEIIFTYFYDGNFLENLEIKNQIITYTELPSKIDILQLKIENQNLNIENSSEHKIIQKQISENTENVKHTISQKEMISIDSVKSDELMNFVSELVTIKESLNIIAKQHKENQIVTLAEKLEKVTRKIQDNALKMRLIPLNNIMIKFEKLIRDIAQKQGKEVIFEADGTDTELDKTIVDSLSEPLIHIFRNCIDHGIELPDIRTGLGKSKKGRIKFFAACNGNYVFIQIHDDGKGIDPEMIKKVALKKFIIKEDEKLTNLEILNLIFIPGFTTAENVTSISGRGIGMDVVKQKIADLRGEIEIDSEINLGTYITIKLPLTLSIVDTLMININNSNYLIPKDVVKNVDEIHKIDYRKIKNNVIFKNKNIIPILDLKKKFGTYINDNEYLKIISILNDDKEYGIIADKIVGEYQAVLKPLGEIFKEKDSFSGASILGDGTLALMIDINKLIKNNIS